MQAKAFPPLRGWVWLRAGFALWRMAPLPLTASAMSMLVCLMFAVALPYAGTALFNILLPVLSVGLFSCFQAVANRRMPSPTLIFSRFGERFKVLFSLGVVTLVSGFFCTLLARTLTGQGAEELAAQDPQALQRMLEQMMPTLALSFLLYTPMAFAAWFAAPLMALRGVALHKALFFSFIACIRNFWALLVFMFLFCVLGGLLVGFILNMAAALAPPLASFLLAPIIMLLVPLFNAAFYVSARDIFGEWPDQ